MDLGARVTLYTVVSGLLFVVGVLAILLGGPMMDMAGLVLITLSGIVFIVDAKDLLVKTDEAERE